MKSKKMLLNVASSVLIYGGLLILSIFTSQIVLADYGSETNGLLSSVGQICSYISLLEAGIGTATIRALFQPLSANNNMAVSDVLASSRRYYRDASRWYFLCIFIVSAVWPLLIETSLSYFTVWGLIFFEGLSGVITFYFTSTIVNYLVASGKNYINNNVHIVVTLLTHFLKLVICYTNVNVVFISLSMVGVNVLKCVFYLVYMQKRFPAFFEKRKADKSLLKQRKSFLIHEISGVVFSSTDTIIISVFCGLAEASIYAVYSMVLGAINSIIGQVFNGTYYVLGDSYSKDKHQYVHTHDLFNSIYVCGTFILFTVAYLMLLPFISLYTEGITDANYMDNKLPLFFVMIQLLSACRIVDNCLIRISLHAKQTINRTIIESVINLAASLILVHFLGIYGVLCGTILALLFRVNDMIIYTNRKILKRSPLKEYKLYLSNFSLFAAIAWLGGKIDINADSYWQLVVIAAISFVVVALLFAVVNFVVSFKEINSFLRRKKGNI